MVSVGFLISVELWLALFAIAVFYWIVRWLKQPRNLPPGPLGLPIIGASYLLSNNFHFDFIKLGKKYGDVFSLYLGTRLTVVINNASVIRENFGKGDDIADRTVNDGVPELWPYRDELFHCPFNKKHTSEKKFALQTLRNFGMTRIENFVHQEVEILLKHFQESMQKPLKPLILTRRALTNTIFAVVCSVQYETGDSEREKVIDLIQRLFTGLSDGILLSAKLPVPLVRLFYPKAVRDSAQAVEEMIEIARVNIKRHRETFDPNNPRDVIDAYLKDGKFEQLGERSLSETVSMLMIDAMETLVFALNFVIVYLLTYPEVQKRIQQEIDDVVGRNRLPCLTDRKEMAYTEATIWEVFRLHSPFPFTLYHTALHDTTVSGFHVPKGAQVIANLHAAHTDPAFFHEPEKFKPERFITEDGQLTGTNNVLPFSLGRRKCAGDQISMAQLFLFVTGIFQKFNLSFSLKPSSKENLRDAMESAMIKPSDYEVVPTER